jgi:hypothetical protein
MTNGRWRVRCVSIMNRRAFLAIGAALLGLLPMVSADSYAQKAGASDTSASHQAPTIEGRWVLKYDNPAGVQKTRIFTFDHDKNGRLIGTQNEPPWQCDLNIRFKGDKLWMKLTPHIPNNIAAPNLPPGTVLGHPISTIFEAEITGDTMKGKLYGENVLGSSINFTGIRDTKVDAVGPTTK